MAPPSTWVGESQLGGQAGVGSAGSQQVPATPYHPLLTTCCCTSHSPSPWGLILGASSGPLPLLVTLGGCLGASSGSLLLTITSGPRARGLGIPGDGCFSVSHSSGGGGTAAVRAAGGLLGHRRHHVHPVSVG